MTSEPLAHKSPAAYATMRAFRPGLLALLVLIVIGILCVGRWQKVEAQSRGEATILSLDDR